MTNEQEKATELPPLLDQDPALESLVSVINQGPAQVGVTLYASGNIISGMLVGPEVYFKRLSELLRNSGDGGVAMAQWSDFWADATRYEDNDDDDVLPTPAHIHLLDAKAYTPGLGNAITHKTWRGRLSEITGWSLGSLSTTD
ncbi:hypothetical protein [Rhodococcus pyridinivorans]|uniref:Gas vesicle protein n=1 Tax=Rhodococcus pyridinivorans AK37 TaxID=1114960 RepID=H0JL31_9NOCA|nr:hypothetical protein [Rhodococcus pyridinivorans]EHK86366.1 hypothetical protein AK37_01422 [Rhodococcus pyridinivorans AK37]MCD2139545.1 hypothetical protein [Rhodococcus pyridinivorans]